MNTVVSLHRDIETGLITIDNPPVNALSEPVRAQLLSCLDAAEADPDIHAIVLRCAGRTFSAGADIHEFGKPPQKPYLPDVLERLDQLSKVTVAALHGTALGGGLEMALCCHYRIVERDARIGLPESLIGLLPGAGGTQRLPRLIGIQAALDMMITGKAIGAKRAVELGLVDEVVTNLSLDEAAVQFARHALQTDAPLRRTSQLDISPVSDSFFDDYRQSIARRYRGQHAPERIVQCVEAAVSVPFREGLKIERELFLKCLNSTQSSALQHQFFAERAAAKVPGLDPAVKAQTLQSVGVIGAGTMGSGIALACTTAGLSVTMLDSNADGLARGVGSIIKILASQVSKGRMTPQQAEAARDRLSTSLAYGSLADHDLIIEAVFESMAVKESVFQALDKVCKPGAILASNTSTLDIDRIAGFTGRPEAVIGLHFFSPANIMRLLEIVRGRATDAQVIASALGFAKSIGKLGVVVGNCFGFVGNRMLYGYGRENQFLLLEGATPAQIDSALTDWGMAMGPNAVGDLAGLDVGYKVRQERSDLRDDPRYYRVANLLAEAGRYGQKTGAGIFRYEAGLRTPLPDPEVQEMIDAESQRMGIVRRDIDDTEIVERCICALIVEGAKLLETGIASRASDIDVIWTNGYGFPRYRGGPMFYADTVGVRKIYDKVCAFRDRFGDEYWSPPALLEKLAREQARFADLDHPRSSSP